MLMIRFIPAPTAGCTAPLEKEGIVKSRGLWGKKILDIQERETEIPSPGENHVIVKIRACGVCGTDLNFLRDWAGDPMPLGHEIAAEVVEVGKSVTTVQPGDRVIVEDCTMCGTCDSCKAGHPEFCRNMFTMEGQPGMGQFMSVRHNSLVKFEGLDFVSACLTEPLAVSLTAVIGSEIPLGGSVAVLGSGPLGLMAAKLARLRGAGFVAMTGTSGENARNQARKALAAEFGCDLFLEAGKQDVEEEIKRRLPNGVDRVIVSSPPRSIQDALKIVRFGGMINFFGLNLGGQSFINVDINDLVFRKITLRPTFAEPAINFPVSNRLLKDGLINARALITHTFGFEDARKILSAALDGSQPIVKAVMTPDGL